MPNLTFYFLLRSGHHYYSISTLLKLKPISLGFHIAIFCSFVIRTTNMSPFISIHIGIFFSFVILTTTLSHFDSPKHHILSIFLLILFCEISFENGLKGRILWYSSCRSNSYFKIDKALKYNSFMLIDPLNALLNVYVS